MKKLTIKGKNKDWNKQVFNLLREHGYTISNPDNANGTFIDVIRDKKINSKLAGFDLLAMDSLRNVYNIIETDDLNIIEDWIKDHA